MIEGRGFLPLSESLEESERYVTLPLTPTRNEVLSNLNGAI